MPDHIDDDIDDDVLPLLIELTRIVARLNMLEPDPVLSLLVNRAARVIERHERDALGDIRIQ